jgi:hypothetical protein
VTPYQEDLDLVLQVAERITISPLGCVRPQNVAQSAIRRRRFSNRSPRR